MASTNRGRSRPAWKRKRWSSGGGRRSTRRSRADRHPMTLRSILLSLAVVVGFPATSLAQQDAPTWRWAWDGNVFFGLNHQDRLYGDVSAWESQNWGMLAVDRPVRSTDRFTVMGMLSLEAFTMEGQGSPQLFQTGESYN